MLVGVGGSGKQSLTRLACFMAEFVWMPIELTRGYTYSDFQEHVKRCFLTAGVDGKSVVMPVVDNQIIDERFLEDINNILNSGEVPNLFPPDELHKIVEDLTPKIREQKAAQAAAAAAASAKDNKDNKDGGTTAGSAGAAASAGADTSTSAVLAVFQQRVRDNLHVVLCMSPVGDSFRTRCRKFPSLINCTTIDWYSKWSSQALLSVATRVLSSVPDTTPEQVRALSDACVAAHESMDEKCEVFYDVMRRRVYTTPKSYLDMLSCYVWMLTERRNELRAQQNRFLTGVTKIVDTKAVVAELKEMLTKLQPSLVEKRKATEVLIAQLDIDTREADKVRVVVERETKLVNQQTEAQRELQLEAASDLDKTRPLLEAAEKAVSSLDRTQLAELRIMKNPPPLVSLALESVCLFFGEAPTFDNAKKICANPSFVTQLKTIIAQKDKVDQKVLVKLKK
jgi:dynein heavy chain